MRTLTNKVIEDELESSLSKQEEIKDSHRSIPGSQRKSQQSNVRNPPPARSQNQPKPNQSRAFEYKENKEERKKPALSGWDVDNFDESENEDLKPTPALKVAKEEDDWDYDPMKKPAASSKQATNNRGAKESGFVYGNLEDDESSSEEKGSDEDYDWGSFEL